MEYYRNTNDIMNQEVLRQVEALCTQEELPACSAACPLHLDARGMIAHIQKGDWDAAYRLYSKAIPFVRVISHTCGEPCRSMCRREEKGGGIQLQKLEQFLVTREGKTAKPPLFLPKKSQSVAIAGGGLRGLAAANDLVRKGYRVTIFEAGKQLGGSLRLFASEKVPEEAIRLDIDEVLKLPVTVKLGVTVPVGTAEEIEGFMKDGGFDAIYLACQSPVAAKADGDTLITSVTNVVAGRRSGWREAGDSTIYDLLDGRSAATTLDRLLQNVSIKAGREKEGSSKTKLYTKMDDIVSAAPVCPDSTFAEAQALEEAKRCIQCECMECVKKCSFLQRHKAYPRRYVREVYNNLSIAMGSHPANKMINACALCSQCEAVCPNGLNMKSIFLAARRRMVQTGKMPASAHEFALLDMQYSMSEEFFLAGTDKPEAGCEYLFFPGCQLSASEPELVRDIYNDLRVRLSGGLGIMLSCCGILAYWAGDTAQLEEVLDKIRREWHKLGEPRIIAACPSCLKTLGDLAGMPAIGIWDVLSEIGFPKALPDAYTGRNMLIHHACSARYDDSMQNGIISLADSLGYKLDMQEQKNQSPCCGYGGLIPFADPEAADNISASKIDTMRKSGEEKPILTYCVNCRDRYIRQGADAYHLLELVYGGENLNRRYPKWSERQENRAELRRALLREVFNEDIEVNTDIKLYFKDGLEEKLETCKILKSDIRRTIENAEKTGRKFKSPANGHFTASNRPGNVTFWVEYKPGDDGYFVFNVYSHRMSAEMSFKSGTEAQADNERK